MMTKKHFKAIAETIKQSSVDSSAKRKLAEDMAITLIKISSNPNFQPLKFVEACQ